MNIRKTTIQQKLLFLTTFLVLLLSSFGWSQIRNNNDTNPTEPSIEQMVAKIDTAVDPEFVYNYEQTKLVPPNGKTLLIMGQTVERISEYVDHFPNQKKPGGWSAYWGVPEFKGIIQPFRNETGSTQHHQMIIDSFPNTVLHSALWMVGKYEIANRAGKGAYDKVIKQYGAWAKSANRPIYLRIGYEFDGPHNALEPKEYVKAYRRIVNRLRKVGADNIAFVWHSYAARPFNDYKVSDWYPGDDCVDWVGISVFGHAYGGNDFGAHCDSVLNFAKAHRKPVMIAESNPIRGIDNDNTDAWDEWFVNYFNFIYRKNIKAVSFINEDWPSLYIPGISEWKDARLYNNEKIAKAWFEETNKERYLKQSPELFEELGYVPE